MKTCWDMTSPIGFQGICCDKSLMKLVYFSAAYVCNNTAFESQMCQEEQIVLNGDARVLMHGRRCCVSTLPCGNIKKLKLLTNIMKHDCRIMCRGIHKLYWTRASCGLNSGLRVGIGI